LKDKDPMNENILSSIAKTYIQKYIVDENGTGKFADHEVIPRYDDNADHRQSLRKEKSSDNQVD